MNQMLRLQVAIITLSVSVLGASAATAQLLARREHGIEVPHVTVPPLVRFTGTLVPPGKKSDDSLHTLRVFIRNNEWLFRLDNVETLTGMNRGWMILNDIFPPELRFTGPENLLRLLQDAESTGKPITVEGRLYIGDRMFVVTGAEEVADSRELSREKETSSEGDPHHRL
jgi:hypothetical protein